MNVEIERPKLLAARRLGDAVKQRQLSLSAAAASKQEGRASDTTGMDKFSPARNIFRGKNRLKPPHGVR